MRDDRGRVAWSQSSPREFRLCWVNRTSRHRAVEYPGGGESGVEALSRIASWLGENEATISAVVGIAVLTGILFAGIRSLLHRRTEPTTETTSEEDPLLALPTGPVVAVLPFENLSRDPDQEYFSDGLTNGIITALSRFRDLFVIARNSTFRYKGQAGDSVSSVYS